MESRRAFAPRKMNLPAMRPEVKLAPQVEGKASHAGLDRTGEYRPFQEACLRRRRTRESAPSLNGSWVRKRRSWRSRSTAFALSGFGWQALLGAVALPPARRFGACARLECHADPHRALPDHPATLSRRAVEHLKALRQLDELLQLQARPAGGVVDEDAFDDRGLRIDKDLGDPGNPALGA